MKLVLAIVVSFLIFIFSWLVNGFLMMGLALMATAAGVKPGVFLFINIFLIWILAPGLGSGVAIYATGKKFEKVDINLVHVGFVSIVVVLLFLMFMFSAFVYAAQGSGYGNIVLLLAQGAAVVIGARIGKGAVTSSQSS